MAGTKRIAEADIGSEVPGIDRPRWGKNRGMPVHRCVCHEISFRELKQIAERDGATLEELARRTGCTTSCGLCRPYIEVMLATGRTELPVMTEEECRKMAGGGP